jgi:hypothetical protein
MSLQAGSVMGGLPGLEASIVPSVLDADVSDPPAVDWPEALDPAAVDWLPEPPWTVLDLPVVAPVAGKSVLVPPQLAATPRAKKVPMVLCIVFIAYIRIGRNRGSAL